MSGYWLDASSTSNRYIQTYMRGFLDMSGGNLLLRNNNIIVQGGDISLNGNLTLNGNLNAKGNVLFDSSSSTNILGSMVMGTNLNMAIGIINQSTLSMSGGYVYVPTDPQELLYLSQFVNYDASPAYSTIGSGTIVLGNINLGNTTTTVMLGDMQAYGNAYFSGNGKFNAPNIENVNFGTAILGAGSATLSSVYVSGDASINGNLLIQGNITVRQGSITNANIINTTVNTYQLIISEDISLNGRLQVKSDTSLNGNVQVIGNIGTGSNAILNIQGNTTVTGNIIGTYNVTGGNLVATSGNVTAGNIISASSVNLLSGSTTILSSSATGVIIRGSTNTTTLYATSDVSVNGNLLIRGNITVQQGSITNANIINTTVNSYQLIVSEDLSLNGELLVQGDASFGGNLIINQAGTGTTGFVGIGKSNPTNTLDVTGNIRATTGLALTGTNGLTITSSGTSTVNSITALTGTTGFVGIVTTNPTNTLDVTGNIRATTGLALTGTGGLAVTSSGTSTVNSITALTGTGGFVGINQTVPTNTLDVTGNIRATTGLALTGTGGLVVTSSGTSTVNSITALTGTTGFVGINQTVPTYALDVTGGIRATTGLALTGTGGLTVTSAGTSTVNSITALTGTTGFVGINQTVPTYALDVTGNIRATTGLSVTGLTTTTILYTTSDASLNGNLFVKGNSVINGDISLNGNIVVYGNLRVQQVQNANIINTTINNYQLVITDDISLNGRLLVSKDASFGGNLVLTGTGTTGFVGIGTTTPQFLLDVNGTSRVTGLSRVSTVSESFVTNTGTTSPYTFDYSTSAVFYVTSPPTANFTANFTNIPTEINRTYIATLIITSTTNKRFCNSVQINGAVAITPNYAGGIPTSITSGSVITQTIIIQRISAGDVAANVSVLSAVTAWY